jgi:hypothetical protein
VRFDARVSGYDETASGKSRCRGRLDLAFVGESFV